jgi:hypothetical protein
MNLKYVLLSVLIFTAAIVPPVGLECQNTTIDMRVADREQDVTIRG